MACVPLLSVATVLKHLSNRLNTDCFLFHTFTIFVKVNYVQIPIYLIIFHAFRLYKICEYSTIRLFLSAK